MVVNALTESTRRDAEEVIKGRFGVGALDILEKVMRNPLRKNCVEAGDIVYDNGVPVCFHACILRRLYLRDHQILGRVGGLTCLKKGAPVEAYLDVRAAAAKQRYGSVMGFGNSQNAESAYAAHRLARKRNATTFEGPESCTRYLWRVIRPLECGMYFIRRKLLKWDVPKWKDFSTLGSAKFQMKVGDLSFRRLSEMQPAFFDKLMGEYIKHNEGLVCSRTAEEVNWIFGDRIADGSIVVLGAFRKDEPVGYIILNGRKSAKRWSIHDWFAVKNDVTVLEGLLKVACRFLKKKTPAIMLEVSGFPSFAQPILRKYCPHVRDIRYNQFSWGSRDKEFRSKVTTIIDTEKSWFFGPYDGDLAF